MPNRRIQESETIEFKSQLDANCTKAVVAFLNSSKGGTLYIGVDDFGKALNNIDNIDTFTAAVANKLADSIEPSIAGLCSIESYLWEDEEVEVVRVSVASGTNKPYCIKSKGLNPKGCYYRLGNTSQPMPEAGIATMMMNRRNYLYETPINNQNLTFRYLREIYSEYPYSILNNLPKTLNFYTSDRKYNLIANLFADVNNISLRVVKFAGIERLDIIENNEYGYTSILKATESIINKLDAENTNQCVITFPKRIEQRLIDPTALREAIINAIVHNDYSTNNPPVFELFSDRLEITSYGGPIDNISDEEFFAGGSRPRCQEIMRIFQDAHYVERIGVGMSRILKTYGREIYTITDSYIKVTFKFRFLHREDYENSNTSKPTDLVNEKNSKTSRFT